MVEIKRVNTQFQFLGFLVEAEKGGDTTGLNYDRANSQNPTNNQKRRLKKKSDFHANCRHSHSDFLDGGGTQQKDEEHCCDSEEEEDRWIILN